MIESKGWNWKGIDDDSKDYWRTPSVESFYLLNRWKGIGFERFLDLGCGLGRHSMLFGQHGFFVHAFDISEDAIGITEEWAEELGLSVDCKVGDMRSLPYENGSIDCILCKNVISHTDTNGVRQAISELLRVLKPDGECYLTLCSKASLDFKQNWPMIDENTKLKMVEGPEYKVPHFYSDYDLIMELFCGFKIVSVSHVEDYYKSGSSAHYHLLVKNGRHAE